MKKHSVIMKKFLSILIVSAFVLGTFVGCSKTTVDDNASESAQTTSHNNIETKAQADTSKEIILNDYLKQYGTEKYFNDAYLDMQYVLLTDSQIVIVLAIKGASQATAIPFSSISKYDSVSVRGVTVITISTHSGTSTAVNLSSSDASELISVLNGK